MNLLDISTVWSLFHVMILNALLYEPRVPKKKACILTACFMGPLVIYNSWVFVRFGNEVAGQLVLFNCTIPSLIFFMLMAKHRNCRLLFTFCLTDTLSLEIIYCTRFLDDALGIPNFWVLFLIRLVIWPVLEWAIIKWLRKPYLNLQNVVKKGWGGFAGITMLFYVILLIMATYPVIITERLEYMPALLLVMALMPLIYWCILRALFHQQELHETEQQKQLLQLQSNMLVQRVDQNRHLEQTLAIQRHDLHHRFQTVDTMLERGDVLAARQYIAASQEALAEIKAKRWCNHSVLDAVFSACFKQAEAVGIEIIADLDIPDDLPVNAVELSTVFANALENAVHAVSELPESQRKIICKCIRHPQMMFRVSNPYSGEVHFDENGEPVAGSSEHGFGTKSIAAYCEKYNAVCTYKAENGWFSIQLTQTIWYD